MIMKTKIILFLSMFIFSGVLFSQTKYTPYDNIPGIIKSYKPEYDESYPDWAKMLYQYPVNFNDVCDKFDAYVNSRTQKEKSPIIRYMKIWRRALGEYVNDKGEIILPDIDKINANLLKAQKLANSDLKSTNNSGSDWNILGPINTFYLKDDKIYGVPKSCPWQANVYSFDVTENDPDILYCGTETGFVCKSEDKGETWELLSKEFPFGAAITSIAIDPDDTETVYVGTGLQMYKTIDGGETWGSIFNKEETNFNTIRVDPDDTEKIIAATGNGIYLSKDAGETWTKSWEKETWDLDFNSEDSEIVYAVSYEYTSKGKVFTLLTSDDGGESFSKIENFPKHLCFSGALLAVTKANVNVMYVSMLSRVKKGGSLGEFSTGQGFFDFVLEVSPNDENMVFWGTCILWKSTNGARTFKAIGGYAGKFNIHPDIQCMKILPNGDTWVATDGGMNLSTDYFKYLSNYSPRVNGIIGSDMWGFDQGWNEDIIVGGRYHNGNTALSDAYGEKALRMGGGESATGWVIKGKSHHVAFDDLGAGWILPKTAEGKPQGRFPFTKYPNMKEYGSWRGNIATHPYYSGTLLVGEGNSIWKSTDFGVNYELLHTFSGDVMYFDYSYANPDVIYADIQNSGFYRSSDGGKTWSYKPALSSNGRSSWKGHSNFVTSPTNENVIYACYAYSLYGKQNAPVVRSEDGGNSWEVFGKSKMGYTKNLVIQPDEEGNDLLYLFTSTNGGNAANVYYRKSGMNEWKEFSNGYPAGMNVNKALPFYRDSKIRVGGTCSVWESPLAVTNFKPIITPWVEQKVYNCSLDTVRFEDHSIINHEGAQWEWSFSETPAYIDNANKRNPKVVFDKVGSVDVTIKVTKDGETYTKTINNMIELKSCPSIHDCGNPGVLPKDEWKLLYVDSQETVAEDNSAINAFDDNVNTIWHTDWNGDVYKYPHELHIDLGKKYTLSEFTYLARQDGENGKIKDYELFVSDDKSNWGNPVAKGTFNNGNGYQKVQFNTPVSGRYFRFLALSEVNGKGFASCAEISLTGCIFGSTGIDEDKFDEKISAYPIPTEGVITLRLPTTYQGDYKFKIYSTNGVLVDNGIISTPVIDLNNLSTGVYFVILTNNNGQSFKLKVVKK